MKTAMAMAMAASSFRKLPYLPSLPPVAQLPSPSSGGSGLNWRIKNCRNKNGSLLSSPIIKGGWKEARVGSSKAKANTGSDDLVPAETNSSISMETIQRKLKAFYVFARPHAIVGDLAPVISTSLFALEKLSDISPPFFIGLAQAIVSVALMHIYVCGLNELTDMDMDKVNKPHRPIVSGEFSARTAWIISVLSAILSFGVAWIVGSRPLLCALFAHFALGTAYSIKVPLLRWKVHPITATLCILAMQVFPTPLAFYLHIQTFVLGRPAFFPKAFIVGTGLMSILSIVLSNFKDIPDIDGDRLSGVKTLAVRIGSEKVFWIGTGIIQIVYLGATLFALTRPYNWRTGTLVASQILLTLVLWNKAKSIDLGSTASTESFVRLTWKLFFAEYFLIHLLR